MKPLKLKLSPWKVPFLNNKTSLQLGPFCPIIATWRSWKVKWATLDGGGWRPRVEHYVFTGCSKMQSQSLTWRCRNSIWVSIWKYLQYLNKGSVWWSLKVSLRLASNQQPCQLVKNCGPKKNKQLGLQQLHFFNAAIINICIIIMYTYKCITMYYVYVHIYIVLLLTSSKH